MPHTISNYLTIQNAYWPTFTAGGDQIAFLSTITGVPQLWQVADRPDLTVALWPDLLTHEAERVQGVWPDPAGQNLIFGRDAGGNEKSQLFLISATGETRPLTEGHEEAMHLFGCWLPDGETIIFAANRRNPGLFDLYRQHLNDDEAEMIWRHDHPGYLWGVEPAPDGKRLVLVRAAASAAHDLLEVDLRSGEVQALSPADTPARYHAAYYNPAGDALYVLTDLNADFLHLRQLDLATRESRPVLQLEWDIAALAQSPDRQRFAFTVNVNGDSELHLWEPDSGQMTQSPKPDNTAGVFAMLDDQLSFSPDGRRLAFSYTSATRTSDAYVWDFSSGRAPRAITRSSHGGIDPATFVAPQLVHYPTFDGRDIPAWYYRPANGVEPRPVVVMVHGGPESQFRPYFNFVVQYLVHQGYAVLAPNVRGSTGYGKAYSALDNVEKRMDSVADLAHLAYWIRERPELDEQRVAVYGGSYGGFMVLSALTTYPELWAAGVDIVGISNFVTFLENTSDYRRSHRESEYGSLARDREFLDRISPNRHLEQIQAPLMVIHGANDPRVPLSEAEQIVEALQERDIPVEFLVFHDEGHGVVKLRNKRVMYPAVASFLQRHVPVRGRS